MKVLFLDIDGVCNCKTTTQRHGGYIGIDPYMAFLVGKITLDTDCKVVLSSTWRLLEDSREEVRKRVVEFIDVTPSNVKKNDGTWCTRGEEIQLWLNEHPEVTQYAILDDDTDGMRPHGENYFRTYWDEGLTEETAKKVTEHLKEIPQQARGASLPRRAEI